ncbi:transposase, partial [Exiguobacterium sp. S3]|uniref:transposase n=1 Tax=Exiguobacterium sp. S3 TaxID=483245 RepID=UPI001BEA81F1
GRNKRRLTKPTILNIIKRAKLYIKKLTFIDSTVYLNRLDHVLERFHFPLEAVALDAGYFTTGIAKALVERGIFGVIARRRFGGKKGMFRKTRYTYLPEEDAYLCPARQRLTYQTTDRHGYHHYVSDPSICQNCPLLEKCTSSRTHRRDITRHVDEHYREQVNENRLSASGKSLYRLRPQTVERSFADGKELHGLRFTFYRGTAKVQRANLVAATAQNMKKLANLLARKDRLHNISSIFCRTERLKLVEHKKRRTRSHLAIWFVNSLRDA